MGRRTVVLCGCIVLAGIIAGVLIWNHDIERQFPMWRTPCMEANSIDPDVELRFGGIDHDVTLRNGELCDQVIVNLKGIPGQAIGYADTAWVDYFHDGEWHTVWENGLTMLSARVIDGADVREEEIPIRKSVPRGLFAREGQYRLFIDGVGYCGIEVTGAEINERED